MYKVLLEVIDMTLGQKQRKFTRMIGLLIEYAYQTNPDYHDNPISEKQFHEIA